MLNYKLDMVKTGHQVSRKRTDSQLGTQQRQAVYVAGEADEQLRQHFPGIKVLE